MIGKIIEKRYVVLEEIGPDGAGFRYLVYDMSSLKRLHIRIDASAEGDLSGATHEIVPDSQSLAPAAGPTSATSPVTAPAPAAAAINAAHPRFTPPPAAKPAPAAPAFPGGLRAPLRAAAECETLKDALERQLATAAPTVDYSQDAHNMTLPIDLASAEEIAAPPAATATPGPVTETRGRLRTRQLETAWFALGEQLDEGPPPEDVTARIRQLQTQEELERQAGELSPDDYRRYALDLAPPAPPPPAGTSPAPRSVTPPPRPPLTVASGELSSPSSSPAPAPLPLQPCVMLTSEPAALAPSHPSATPSSPVSPFAVAPAPVPHFGVAPAAPRASAIAAESKLPLAAAPHALPAPAPVQSAVGPNSPFPSPLAAALASVQLKRDRDPQPSSQDTATDNTLRSLAPAMPPGAAPLQRLMPIGLPAAASPPPMPSVPVAQPLASAGNSVIGTHQLAMASTDLVDTNTLAAGPLASSAPISVLPPSPPLMSSPPPGGTSPFLVSTTPLPLNLSDGTSFAQRLDRNKTALFVCGALAGAIIAGTLAWVIASSASGAGSANHGLNLDRASLPGASQPGEKPKPRIGDRRPMAPGAKVKNDNSDRVAPPASHEEDKGQSPSEDSSEIDDESDDGSTDAPLPKVSERSDAERLVLRARQALKRHQYRKAHRLARRALNIQPESRGAQRLKKIAERRITNEF